MKTQGKQTSRMAQASSKHAKRAGVEVSDDCSKALASCEPPVRRAIEPLIAYANDLTTLTPQEFLRRRYGFKRDWKKCTCTIPWCLEIFACLDRIEHPSVAAARQLARDPELWDFDLAFEAPLAFYFAAGLNLGDEPHIANLFQSVLLDNQTIRGALHPNSDDHARTLRAAVALMPESEAVKAGIDYLLNNLEDLRDEPEALANGGLALWERDPMGFADELSRICDLLCKELKTPSRHDRICARARALSLFSRVETHTNRMASVIDELLGEQETNGLFGEVCPEETTATVVIALTDAGLGPQMSVEHHKREKFVLDKRLRCMRPLSLQTDPNQYSFTIRTRIRQLIKEARRRVWIASRFVTEFWTDIASLRRDKPELDIRVITAPAGDMKSAYVGSGKKFIDSACDTLQKSLQGNYRTSKLLHARVIVVDSVAIVGSADLTTEQLQNEFNLAIEVRDAATLQDIENFFNSVWTASAPRAPNATEVKEPSKPNA